MRERPDVGIVGLGRAGTALAIALRGSGWPLRALASRDAGRRASLRAGFPDALLVADPSEVAAVVDVVLLAVPDDVIGQVAASLDARPGSIVAHLSGVHPAAILRGRAGDGVGVGAFHPLVAFADLDRALEALRGAWVAIDGDPAAVEVLQAMATSLGARSVVLDPALADPTLAKAAHHAAAVLAAGGFIALLDAIAELGRVAGLGAAAAIEVYGSLVRQGLDNAPALGVGAALTGPVVRADVGTVAAHLHAIDAFAPDVRALYLALARRQLAIARATGALDGDRAAALERLLEG